MSLSSSQPLSNSPPLVQPWSPLLARPDGTSLNMIDKISSVDVAYGVSRAALLPLDMDREKGNSYDSLMKSIFQSSAKVSKIPFYSCLTLLPFHLSVVSYFADHAKGVGWFGEG